jgi:hypothetical protein
LHAPSWACWLIFILISGAGAYYYYLKVQFLFHNIRYNLIGFNLINFIMNLKHLLHQNLNDLGTYSKLYYDLIDIKFYFKNTNENPNEVDKDLIKSILAGKVSLKDKDKLVYFLDTQITLNKNFMNFLFSFFKNSIILYSDKGDIDFEFLKTDVWYNFLNTEITFHLKDIIDYKDNKQGFLTIYSKGNSILAFLLKNSTIKETFNKVEELKSATYLKEKYPLDIGYYLMTRLPILNSPF